MDELERQIGPLERQAKKAKQFLAYKNELFEIEISVLVEEVESLDASIREIERTILEAQGNQVEQTRMLERNEADIDALRQEIYQLDAKVQSLQQDYTQAMEESVQLEKRKVELDEKRKYTLQVADLRQKKAALNEMRQEARYEYEDRKKRLDALRTEYAFEPRRSRKKRNSSRSTSAPSPRPAPSGSSWKTGCTSSRT